MPSLRKRVLPSKKVHWDIRYWIVGKQKIYKIDETDRRTAERIYHEFCRRLAEGKFKGERVLLSEEQEISPNRTSKATTKGTHLLDLAKLTEEYAAGNKSPKTSEREELTFRHLVRVLGNVPVADITPSLVEKYKAIRLKEVTPSTINIEIRILNTAIQQAKSLGWDCELPNGSFKQVKVPDGEPPKWLNEDQIELLITNADSEFRAFLQFLLHTGCRRNEALGIAWEDIDLQKRQLLIRGEVAKMGKRRSIPINDILYNVLFRFRGDRKGQLFPNYAPNQVSMKFKRLARKIGLPAGYPLHSLRSTFGSTLINKGVDIYTVSKLLGHSSVKVTEKHYLALDPEHAKAAINQLEYGK